MQSGFRSLICGLCCVAGAMASGPTTVAEVKAMPAVLDNFDDLIGNEGPKQNCIGAAKGVITSGSMSKAHTGKGYWYAYNDDESSVTNAAGDIPITASNFDDLIDSTEKCLSAKLVISTASIEFPYAGFGCDLTAATEFLDLSKMTALSIKAKGSGTVRVFFRTEDYDGEDWGYYGYNLTLSAAWKTTSIPKADLEPEEGSLGYEEDWTWTHGAKAVNKFHIQTIAAEGDAEVSLDDITLTGMTYADFGWTTSIITGKTTQFCTKPLTVSDSRINYSVTQPQNLSIGLFNAMGSRVATLFNGNVAAGSHSVPMNLQSSVANGNYFVVLKGAQTAVQPITIAK